MPEVKCHSRSMFEANVLLKTGGLVAATGSTGCLNIRKHSTGWYQQNLAKLPTYPKRYKSTRLTIYRTPVWVGGQGLCRAGSRITNVDFATGDVLHNRYKVEGPIGRGGNAVTYHCTDQQTGQGVAIKVLSLRGLRDWKQLDLFQREAQILQNLDHPGIPAYIDSFEDDTPTDRCFFLVQKLIQGASLEELVMRGWRVEESEVERVAVQLLEILKYLSTRRPPVVHRDVKPSNIIIETGQPGGNAFLVDFGGVQAVVSADDHFGSTIIGTYGFMAPEQFRGAAQPGSDLYGLGGTLLYLLSGRPPSDFSLNRMKLETSTVHMSYKLKRVVDGLLEPVVEDRLTVDAALSILKGQNLVHKNVISGSRFASQDLRRADSRGDNAATFLDTPEFGEISFDCGGIEVTVSRKGGTLAVDIPPAPLGKSVNSFVFALTWNAFVASWTITAFSSGGVLFALFSLPFWVTGFNLLRPSDKRIFIRERLEIGDSNWSLQVRPASLPWQSSKDADSSALKTFTGETSSLLRAQVQETSIVNGESQGRIILHQGEEQIVLGEGVDMKWLQRLSDIINKHLRTVREVIDVSTPNESSSDSITF